MLLNSFQFLLFFPVVVIVYYILTTINSGRNIVNFWLLIVSYYFYLNLNPVYGILLAAITIITYGCGIFLERYKRCKKKKLILAVCLLLNFSSLFIFKYYNFVNESISDLLIAFGLRWEVPYLKALLPIGISFFTFQAAGYVIDVYRGIVKAEKNIITYSLFVSFFPVILSGPIQKARVFLPQLKEKHPIAYDNVILGGKMMIWGYFMKLCVADRLGTYVDSIFNNIPQHNGTSIIIASFFYTIQIYGDFAGYSLVAIGCAKVMGFNLPENFHRPYFSTSIKEFWKRWHIALSSWFMEYLYFPLGGSRVKYWRYLMNLMIVFLVSGLWHGAAWTFILWGVLHGLYQIVEALRKRFWGEHIYNNLFAKILKILFIFILVNIAWIFFRANTINDAFFAIQKILLNQGSPFISPMAMLFGIISSIILFVKDYADEFRPSLAMLSSRNKKIAIMSNTILVLYILLFGVLDSSQFIYFQF